MAVPHPGTARLSPGDKAPSFSLPTDNGDILSLKDLRGRKVILYFYPAAMTPGCTKQACDFRDNLQRFVDAGYAVVGLSPDKPEKLASFRQRDGLTFPLVSDVSRQTLAAYGAYGEKQLYGKTVVGVIRSTFLLDEKATITQASYGVKATGHVAKLIKDLGLS
ncbi:MAG: thioredoxin-dependent thiol peroxidase [Actinomycetota bacterium]|nr:thioredoxin-dependent thiol peroxidase [Actinomycetota bacterium]